MERNLYHITAEHAFFSHCSIIVGIRIFLSIYLFCDLMIFFFRYWNLFGWFRLISILTPMKYWIQVFDILYWTDIVWWSMFRIVGCWYFDHVFWILWEPPSWLWALFNGIYFTLRFSFFCLLGHLTSEMSAISKKDFSKNTDFRKLRCTTRSILVFQKLRSISFA